MKIFLQNNQKSKRNRWNRFQSLKSRNWCEIVEIELKLSISISTARHSNRSEIAEIDFSFEIDEIDVKSVKLLWNRWNCCEIDEFEVKLLKLLWKQCKAMQDNARQCEAMQGNARQGNARQCKAMQGKGKTWQSKAKLNTFRHNRRFRWNCSFRFQRFLFDFVETVFFDFNDFLSISLKLFFSISTIFFQVRWNCFLISTTMLRFHLFLFDFVETVFSISIAITKK